MKGVAARVAASHTTHGCHGKALGEARVLTGLSMEGGGSSQGGGGTLGGRGGRDIGGRDCVCVCVCMFECGM